VPKGEKSMASNKVAEGGVMTLAVPAGGVTSGVGVLIGSIFLIALQTVAFAATAVFDGAADGIWDLAKTNAQAWNLGDKIFWDNTNKVATTVANGTRSIGVAVAAAANPSTVGRVRLDGVMAYIDSAPAPASYATVGPQTYTAADMLGGIIVRDPNGASRSDVLPTAALLVAAIPGVQVGDVVTTLITNGADAAETITIGAGAGGAFDANQTAASRIIGQNSSKIVKVRITNIGAGTEAYVAYA
jgi:predicted RecA/RadA family phage recombinase